MGKLNEPRNIPYDFKVFELDGVVWLFDDSSREYPCTATKHIYAEPLYLKTDDEGRDVSFIEPAYFLERDVEPLKTYKVPVEFGVGEDEREAWDGAREEALANYLI